VSIQRQRLHCNHSSPAMPLSNALCYPPTAPSRRSQQRSRTTPSGHGAIPISLLYDSKQASGVRAPLKPACSTFKLMPPFAGYWQVDW